VSAMARGPITTLVLRRERTARSTTEPPRTGAGDAGADPDGT
jgi:hypothetical protein